MRQTDKVQLWPGTCLCDSSQKKLCYWSRTHSACKSFCSKLSSGTSNHIISEESRGWEKNRTYKHGTPQDSGSVSFHPICSLLCVLTCSVSFPLLLFMCLNRTCAFIFGVSLSVLSPSGIMFLALYLEAVIASEYFPTWYLTCPRLINNTSLL